MFVLEREEKELKKSDSPGNMVSQDEIIGKHGQDKDKESYSSQTSDHETEIGTQGCCESEKDGGERQSQIFTKDSSKACSRAAGASKDAEEEKEHLNTGSEDSTASFDLWAFDISDSRTLAQQHKMTEVKKDSSKSNSMTSS